MPVATSSRRIPRRQNSSDIEEDRPSQPRENDQVDEDEDEDEQPRRRANGVKKEKKLGNSSRRGAPPQHKDENADGEADLDDEDDKIDIDNFQDQPIAKADVKKLMGIAQDWNVLEKTIRLHWEVVKDTGVAMADAAEGDDAEEVGHTPFCLESHLILHRTSRNWMLSSKIFWMSLLK